jgi:hypothetical protein
MLSGSWAMGVVWLCGSLWWVGKISNHLQAVPRCTHEMNWLLQHLGTHQDRVHAHKSESDKVCGGAVPFLVLAGRLVC